MGPASVARVLDRLYQIRCFFKVDPFLCAEGETERFFFLAGICVRGAVSISVGEVSEAGWGLPIATTRMPMATAYCTATVFGQRDATQKGRRGT